MVMSRCHLGNDVLKSGKHVLSETPGQSCSVGVPRSLGKISIGKTVHARERLT